MWGAYQPHSHTSPKNLCNALLVLIALIPSIWCVRALFLSQCAPCLAREIARYDPPSANHFRAVLRGFRLRKSPPQASVPCNEWPLANYLGDASSLLDHPVWTINLLFFLNISLGFWIVGLVQRSFWLIDPYWTLLPPFIGHYYRAHPCAQQLVPLRGSVSLVLLWIWSARLTHSYFRREGWKFGEREDWRYTKMASQFPQSWWLLSFFAVGLAQQPMLVGISAPLHFTSTSSLPWTAFDMLATLLAVLGIVGAYISDTQLAAYVATNRRRHEAGEPIVPILREGIWQYSRHPNYFFEQVFWWSIALFAVSTGHPEALIGTVINSAVLLAVTFMTESKMLIEWSPSRAQMYREYQRTTSMWLPLPNWR